MQFQILLAPILTIGATELTSGFAIWQAIPSLGAFNAVLVATAVSHDSSLVSANKAFARVTELDNVPLDDGTVARPAAH